MNKLRSTADLLALGYSHAEMARMSRSGKLVRIRRGAYDLAPDDDRAEIHRRLVIATAQDVSSEAVASHMSAAVLHGLPWWASDLKRVHFTRDRPGGGKVRPLSHIHVSPLPAEDITVVNGVVATTMARTVVDLARSLSMEKAVSIGDAALRRGLALDDLASVLERSGGWRGITAARRSVGFLDKRSESVGESCSRVGFWRMGLPAPDLQFPVVDEDGHLVGRADFCWEEFQTLGEFDGKVKYGRLLKPGQTAGDVIFDEKRREDAMRALLWQMVRWIWDDLLHLGPLEQQIRRTFARSHPR